MEGPDLNTLIAAWLSSSINDSSRKETSLMSSSQSLQVTPRQHPSNELFHRALAKFLTPKSHQNKWLFEATKFGG